MDKRNDTEKTRKGDEKEKLITRVIEILREEDDEVVQAVVKLVKAVKDDAEIKRELINFNRNGHTLSLLMPGSSTKSKRGRLDCESASGEVPSMHTTATSSKAIRQESIFPSTSTRNPVNSCEKSSTQNVQTRSGPDQDQEQPCSSAQAESKLERLASLATVATHPVLLNEIFLKQIYEFCTVETLKNSRLVSIKWRDSSFEIWRKKAVLLIHLHDKDNKITPDDIAQNNFRLTTRPFKCYKINSYIEEFRKGSMSNVIAKVIEELSNSITYLDLYSYREKDWMNMIFFELPELRHLVLRVMHMPIFDFVSIKNAQLLPHRNIKIFQLCYQRSYRSLLGVYPWTQIFKNLPNLESLSLKYTGQASSFLHSHPINDDRIEPAESAHLNIVRSILRAVYAARSEGNFSLLHLKELSVIGHYDACVTKLPEDLVKLIIDCKFPLERLDMDLGAKTEDALIFSILEAHKDTLEYLRGIRAPSNRFLKKKSGLNLKINDYQVRLTKLKEIVLVDGLAWGFHMLRSLHVPNLEKLSIENLNVQLHENKDAELTDIDVNFPLETFLRKVDLSKLEKFKYVGHRQFGKSELKALAKSMTNLKDLGIMIDASIAVDDLKTFWPGLIKYGIGSSEMWCNFVLTV